jgi:lysocardiolipin and lysophospholipid acyltransferase
MRGYRVFHSPHVLCGHPTDRSCSRGEFGEDYFTLTSTFFQGRPPKSVNFYWRRFRIADIPLSTPEEFEQWLRKRWYEKDALIEEYVSTGRLPATPGWKAGEEAHEKSGAGEDGFIETEVRTEHWWEVFQMFAVLGIVAILARLGWSTFWSVREGLARTFA